MRNEFERMSDISDLASRQESLQLEEALSKQKAKVYKATEICVIEGCGEKNPKNSLGEPISRYCSTDCRDLFEKLQRFKR